jgi:hypothetical protein
MNVPKIGKAANLAKQLLVETHVASSREEVLVAKDAADVPPVLRAKFP